MTRLFAPPPASEFDLFRAAEQLLAQSGCIARRRDDRTLEVWEANLSEHYLLTLDRQRPPNLDIIQVDGL